MTELLIPLSVSFIVGLCMGAFITLVLTRKVAGIVTGVVTTKNEEQLDTERDALFSQVRESFQALSREALSNNSDDFLKIAHESLSRQSEGGAKNLDVKKELIDQTLQKMSEELHKVEVAMGEGERRRIEAFSKLDSRLQEVGKGTASLADTTSTLTGLLGNSRSRGQWGERMAEDVLRYVGFEEGINYRRQHSTSTNSRPDFTFMLPRNLLVHMDVKFPFDNYMRYHESEGDEAKGYLKQFFRDVKNRIKEVTTRDYINPSDGTVDYVLVFVPNESVFTFMVQEEPTLIDEALKQKVVLCSPLSLYAILAVMRQGVENFHLERTGTRILELFATFEKQWQAFNETLEKMGKRIDESQREFSALTTTRKRALEKPLEDIARLREGGE